MTKAKKIRKIILLISILLALSCFLIVPVTRSDLVLASVKDENFYNGPEDDLSLEELKKTPIEDIMAMSEYNSQNYGIVNKAVSQGSKPTCWSYATAASSEISILREGLTNKNKDTFRLSADNIAYVNFNRRSDNDPLYNTSDDVWSADWKQGSNVEDAARRLSQWNGPLDMEPDGKENGAEYYRTPEYVLEDYILVNTNSMDEMKRAIAQYGSVAIGFDVPVSEPDHFIDYHNYYYNSDGVSSTGLHAVTIVGWNDKIPGSMFTDGFNNPNHATQDGGWLIKNSWGESFGNKGFFFLSYDSRMDEVAVAFDYGLNSPNRYNYYYDGRNTNTSNVVKDSDAGAIYRAKKASETLNEYLDAVNVEVFGKNITIDVKVYTDPQSNFGDRYSVVNNPETGNLVATGTRKVYSSGAYKVDLDKQVLLNPDQVFSIVVSTKTERGSSGIALSFEPYSYNDMTYLRENGQWKNAHIHDGTAKIKAYTHTEPKINESKNDIQSAMVKIDDISYDRSKSIYSPKYSVVYDGITLVKGRDYDSSIRIYDDTTAYSEEIIGWGEVIVVGKGNYTGCKKEYFQIIRGKFPGLEGFARMESVTYNFKMNVDSGVKKLKDIILPDGWSFDEPQKTVYDGENVVIINYDNKDNCCYENLSTYITINKTNKTVYDFTNENCTLINGTTSDKFEYTGFPVTPNYALKLNNNVLTKNVDYIVRFKDNMNVGKAKVCFYGIGNYKGVKEFEFNIVKADNLIYDFYLSDGVPVGHSLFGNVGFVYYSDINCRNSVLKPVENNTYYVKPYVGATNNYNGAVADNIEPLQITYKEISPKQNKSLDRIEFVKDQYSYVGYVIEPEIVVYDKDGNVVDKDNYVLSFGEEQYKVGNITITVRGTGDYTGICNDTFRITKSENRIKELKYQNGIVKAKSLYGRPEVTFYSDEACTIEVEKPKPTDYGIYYMKAVVEETESYTGATLVLKLELIDPDIVVPEPDVKPEPDIPPEPDNPDDSGNQPEEEKSGCFGVIESDIMMIFLSLAVCGLIILIKNKKKG